MSQQTIKKEFQGILTNIDSLYQEYQDMDLEEFFLKFKELKKQADYYLKKYGKLEPPRDKTNRIKRWQW